MKTEADSACNGADPAPAKTRPPVLGSHTCVGILHELKRWKDIPFLRDNDGMLPPFIIAVGSRVRVQCSPSILNFGPGARFIDEEAREKVGLKAFGRVSIAVGSVRTRRSDIDVPVAVVETQMGCSATQINLKEVLHFARADGYNLGGSFVKSDGIYVVRAGTCAGVNSRSPSEIPVRIGDVLIATDSYGSIGALIQSTLQSLNYTGINIAAKADALRKLISEYGNLRLSHDGQSLATSASPRLVLRLQRAADSLGIRNLVGPNFAKDSLYAEIGEDGFAMLRDTYGIISTEMEAPAVDALAGEFRRADVPVFSGLVSAAIGAIPGKSFAGTAVERKAAADAERNAMRVAARALSDIANDIDSFEALTLR
ncbi:MAG: hypothetical protein U0R44_04810 [Candidatus Micrarchaeia archaeon]